MKIAMIGQKSIPSRCGGIELVLTNLCPIIVEKGHEVICYNRKGNTLEDEYFIKGKDYKGVKLKKVLTINKKGLAAITSSFCASILVSFSRFDIVHYHAEGPCAMMWIAKLFGKRCIATVHGLDWKREKWKNSMGSKYIKFGEKVMVKCADEIIVLSHNTKKYFKETYNRDTVFIPNGVNKVIKKKPKLITEKFGLKGNDYICSVSRLTEEKGIHYLINAYNKINTDKKLLIVGDTSDSDDYVRYIKTIAIKNTNIIFTGFASGNLLEEIYSNAYMYIIPSNLEGMPLSLLEAMSYGNACIGSDIPEIKEVVGKNALIFRKSDIDDLAKKMVYLLDNPELVNKYKICSSEYITNKYNWEKISDLTINLYKKAGGVKNA